MLQSLGTLTQLLTVHTKKYPYVDNQSGCIMMYVQKWPSTINTKISNNFLDRYH